MSQQINLYNPALAPKVEVLSGRRLVIALAGVMRRLPAGLGGGGSGRGAPGAGRSARRPRSSPSCRPR